MEELTLVLIYGRIYNLPFLDEIEILNLSLFHIAQPPRYDINLFILEGYTILINKYQYWM